MSKNLLVLAVLAFGCAILSIYLEMVLYGGKLDENDVLQESFFLPLTFILLAIGLMLLTASILSKVLKR